MDFSGPRKLSDITLLRSKIQNGGFLSENVKPVIAFDDERLAVGIKPSARVTLLRCSLFLLQRFNKPFKDLTRTDFVVFFNEVMKQNKGQNGLLALLAGEVESRKKLDINQVVEALKINRFYARELMKQLGKIKGYRFSKGKRFKTPSTIELVGKPESISTTKESQAYSAATIQNFKSQIKNFWKWAFGENRYFPPAVDWMIYKRNLSRVKLPDEMLEEKDIKKMINAVDNTRDKAMIAGLYESAARISEFLGLNIGHVKFDQYGTILIVDGKTGQRRIRLVFSSPYLTAWINAHPAKDDPNAPLWISQSTRSDERTRINPNAFNNRLQKFTKRAGVKLHVHPHLFRHSRLTQLAKQLTESELRMFAGWDKTSDMPSVYVHLSGRDIDDKLLEISGVKEKPKPQENPLAPRTCPRCTEKNPATARFCYKCSAVLDIKTALELADTQDKDAEALMIYLKQTQDQFNNALSELQKLKNQGQTPVTTKGLQP